MYSNLPRTAQKEIGVRIDRLINHLDKHDKAAKGLNELKIKKGSRTLWNPNFKEITIAEQDYFRPRAHNEEISHFIRDYTDPGIKEADHTVDEFFGFLGTFVGLKLAIEKKEYFPIENPEDNLKACLRMSLGLGLDIRILELEDKLPDELLEKVADVMHYNAIIINYATGQIAARDFFLKHNYGSNNPNNFHYQAIELFHKPEKEILPLLNTPKVKKYREYIKRAAQENYRLSTTYQIKDIF